MSPPPPLRLFSPSFLQICHWQPFCSESAMEHCRLLPGPCANVVYKHSLCLISGPVSIDVPSFSPSGPEYIVSIEKYNSTTGKFDPVTELTNLQRNSFPLTIPGVREGVYSVRVDGLTPSGRRTFSISRTAIPAGKCISNKQFTLILAFS